MDSTGNRRCGMSRCNADFWGPTLLRQVLRRMRIVVIIGSVHQHLIRIVFVSVGFNIAAYLHIALCTTDTLYISRLERLPFRRWRTGVRSVSALTHCTSEFKVSLDVHVPLFSTVRTTPHLPSTESHFPGPVPREGHPFPRSRTSPHHHHHQTSKNRLGSFRTNSSAAYWLPASRTPPPLQPRLAQSCICCHTPLVGRRRFASLPCSKP